MVSEPKKPKRTEREIGYIKLARQNQSLAARNWVIDVTQNENGALHVSMTASGIVGDGLRINNLRNRGHKHPEILSEDSDQVVLVAPYSYGRDGAADFERAASEIQRYIHDKAKYFASLKIKMHGVSEGRADDVLAALGIDSTLLLAKNKCPEVFMDDKPVVRKPPAPKKLVVPQAEHAPKLKQRTLFPSEPDDGGYRRF